MTGHPKLRRSPAKPQTPLPLRRPLLILVLIVALAVVVSGSLLATGCGSATTTTTAAPETTTTAAPAATTTSVASEPAEGTFPVTVKDDAGTSATIKAKPMRIVSTAPSNTETLFALGVGDRVVGVTSLDDYPPEAAAIAKIGDFQINTEAIMALSPDLVLGQLGNEEALKPVQAAGAPVLILNPTNLEQIYGDIAMVGAATGATVEAAGLIDSLKSQINTVAEAATATGESPKVFYALDNTLWTAGPGSFVDELLKLVNATNVASLPSADSAAAQAYYQFAPEQLVAADPDVILLPNTAYKSIDEFVNDARFAGLKAVKEKRVYLIDDVVVTRPGPRVALGLKALLDAIHPGAL